MWASKLSAIQQYDVGGFRNVVTFRLARVMTELL